MDVSREGSLIVHLYSGEVGWLEAHPYRLCVYEFNC